MKWAASNHHVCSKFRKMNGTVHYEHRQISLRSSPQYVWPTVSSSTCDGRNSRRILSHYEKVILRNLSERCSSQGLPAGRKEENSKLLLKRQWTSRKKVKDEQSGKKAHRLLPLCSSGFLVHESKMLHTRGSFAGFQHFLFCRGQCPLFFLPVIQNF
jgi:hypothetical protein